MRIFSHSKAWSITTLLCVLVGTGGNVILEARAQGGTNPVIQLQSGETLEIATDSIAQNAEYSWILTKERKFISGQRTRFFQTRLAEPGTYTLDVSIQSKQTGQNALQTFSLIVSEPNPSLPNQTDSKALPLKAVAVTNPQVMNGIVYLPPSGGILRIDPSVSQGAIEKYSIDLDNTFDSNNDGDASNDADNADTFSVKSGSPVYFFVLPRATPRSIRLTVNDLSSPEPAVLDIPISFSEIPPTTQIDPNTIIQTSGGPIQLKIKGLNVSADTQFNDPTLEGKQLLFEWDFGDRSRSLLQRPEHTYAVAGTYVISLIVRDISTAEILQNISTTVQVSETLNPSSSSSAQSSSAGLSSSSSSSQNGGGSLSTFSLWSVVKVLFIIILLLGVAIGLYVALTWIKKRTTSSIQETLEKMEDSIVKKEVDKQSVIESSAPMKLKKDVVDIKPASTSADVVDREKAKTEFRTQEKASDAPVLSAGPVPPWLRQSPAPATKNVNAPPPALSSAPNPPEETRVEPPKVTATQAQVEKKKEQEKTSMKSGQAAPAIVDGPVPAWLQAPSPSSTAPAPESKSSKAPAVIEKKTSEVVSQPNNGGKAVPVNTSGQKLGPTPTSTPAPKPQQQNLGQKPVAQAKAPISTTANPAEKKGLPEQASDASVPQNIKNNPPEKVVQAPKEGKSSVATPGLAEKRSTTGPVNTNPQPSDTVPNPSQKQGNAETPIAIIKADSLTPQKKAPSASDGANGNTPSAQGA